MERFNTMSKKKSEQDFLRDKTTTLYESENTVVDTRTGEILHHEKNTKKKMAAEPDFIKVYYHTMMAVQDIDDIPLSFLLALSCHINYTNSSDEKIFFFNNKTTRRSIAESCNVGDNMVAKYVQRSVKCGLLFKTPDRGTYEVNPWLIAKGRWDKIRELQASFCFIEGKWQRVVIEDAEAVPEATPAASSEELSGQLKFDDVDMLIVDDEAC